MDVIDENITAGIVVYNTPVQIVAETLESFMKFHPNLLVIVLCNSLDEQYQTAIRNLGARFDFKLMAYRPNKGFGAGHNEILAEVRTPWYICSNPDIILLESTISELWQSVLAKPDCALIGPIILDENLEIAPVVRPHITIQNLVTRLIKRIFKHKAPLPSKIEEQSTMITHFVSGCFFMSNVEKMKICNGFDEAFFLYAEDADLSVRMEKIGVNYLAVRSKVIHKWSRESSRSFKTFKTHVKSLNKYFMKHGYF